MIDQKKSILNPAIVALLAEGFLSRLSFGLISFALPLYALELGLGLTQIGLLISFHLGISMLFKPSLGGAADRFGLKRSLTAGIALRSVVTLLLTFAGLPWQLFAIESLRGAAKALRTPSTDALLAEHGGKETVASAFAWYFTAKKVADSLGKGLAGILLTLTASNFQLVFFLAFLFSTLPLVVVIRYVRSPERAEEPTDQAKLSSDVQPDELDSQLPAKGSRLALALLPFIGMVFLIAGTAQMLKGLFPILATEYAGLNEAQTGLILTASTVVVLVAGPLFGWLSDNVSRELVLTFRSVGNTVSSLIYIVAPNLAGVTAGKLIDDAGKAAFRPAWGAMMAHVSDLDKRRRAQTMGVLSLGEDAGALVGPILAGFLWSTWGLTVVFGVRVLLAIIAEIYAISLNYAVAQPTAEATASTSLAGSADRLIYNLRQRQRLVLQWLYGLTRPFLASRGVLIFNAVLLPIHLVILCIFGIFAWSLRASNAIDQSLVIAAVVTPAGQETTSQFETNHLEQWQEAIVTNFQLEKTLKLSQYQDPKEREGGISPQVDEPTATPELKLDPQVTDVRANQALPINNYNDLVEAVERTGPLPTRLTLDYQSGTTGRWLTYTITITNVGPTQPVTATLLNQLSPFESLVASSEPTCGLANQGLITCTLNNLSTETPYRLTLTTTVQACYAGLITQTATVTGTGPFINVTPSNRSTVTNTVSLPYPLAARIAYVQNNGPTHNLGLVDSTGRLLNDNLHQRASTPAWSPDGKQLAFFGEAGISDFGGVYGQGNGVYLVDAQGENPRQLLAQDHIKNIAWSADNTKLAIEIALPDQAHEIMVVETGNGQFINRFSGEQPAWSADSQKLVVKSCIPECGLWQVNLDGSEGQQLTFNESDSFPAVSPDGLHLTFASAQEGDWEIYRLNQMTGQVLRLTSRPGSDTTPVFGPCAQEIYFRTDAFGGWRINAIQLDGSRERLVREGVGHSDDWGLARPAIDLWALGIQRP